MGREIVNLIKDAELHELSLQQMIEQGQMNKQMYDALTPEGQEQVRTILFQKHARPIPTPSAVAALEFTVFGLAKLFFRTVSGQPLTEIEQTFYDRFLELVEEHEMPLDATCWQLTDVKSGMLTAKENRARYRVKKTEITGSC